MIESGRRADLVLIDGNPLRDITATQVDPPRLVRRQPRSNQLTPYQRKHHEETPMSLHGLLAGSNFFWYLKDPAGNFSEYYSDMDCIVDDQLWTPEDLEGARGLFAWDRRRRPRFCIPRTSPP